MKTAEFSTAYDRSVKGDTPLARTKRGSKEIMAMRDVIPFEALREHAWNILCITLDEPFQGAARTPELSATQVLTSLREQYKDFGKEQSSRSWHAFTYYRDKDVRAYQAYQSEHATPHDQLAVISGMLQKRYDYVGYGSTLGEVFGRITLPRLGAIARRIERKLGMPYTKGEAERILSYMGTLRLLASARWATLYPIAERVNHLYTSGIVRHTNPDTYKPYLENVLPRTIERSEPTYYVASVVKQDVLAQEELLFGTDANAGRVAEIWKLGLFIRDMSVADEWKIVESLIDGKLPDVVAMVTSVYEKDSRRLPYFISQKIGSNPSWLEHLAQTKSIDYF